LLVSFKIDYMKSSAMSFCTTLIFALLYGCGGGSSSTTPASVAPATASIVSNAVPVANAGIDQTVPVGAIATLEGGASADANGDVLTYSWQLTLKPAGSAASLSANSTSRPQISPDVEGTYTAALAVSDGKNTSSADMVSIIAVKPPAAIAGANVAPVANAGADQRATTGATINLDGSLSKDVNGDRLNYLWTLLAKPEFSNAVLDTTSQVTPSFRADVSGVYEIRLSVNDGKLDSASSDLITIVAAPASAIVIADTGTYRCASLSNSQASALYASGHIYLDRDHDGKPCEANDLLNELASPYVAPSPTTSGRCWVNGYKRKNGTYVNGYYRSC
jgi:hypothetical protein